MTLEIPSIYSSFNLFEHVAQMVDQILVTKLSFHCFNNRSAEVYENFRTLKHGACIIFIFKDFCQLSQSIKRIFIDGELFYLTMQ